MNQDRLAVQGGAPVRTKPFPSAGWGAHVVGEEEMALVSEVIRNRSLFRAYGSVPPHMVDDLEAEARAYLGAKHTLAVSSGTAALLCALAGLGVGPGDEVVVPSLMWLSDFNAPVLLGATPVVADIDRTLSLDPDDLERKIGPRTKAAVIVHFMGGVGHLGRVLEIGRAKGVAVVEDCAQSFGALFKGRPVGTLGEAGCFSFQHNKVVTSGEGGLVATGDPVVFERAARYHDLGGLRPALEAQLEGGPQLDKFAGSQFRMGELAGAVALAQLRKVDRSVLSVTRSHFRRLRRELAERCPGVRFRESPDPSGDAGIALFLDIGTPEKGQAFAQALQAEGIPVGATTRSCNLLSQEYVQAKRQPHPAMPPFGRGCPGEKAAYGHGSCPNTDPIVASMVAVMITPRMTDQDADDVRDAVAKVWNDKGFFGQ